MPKTLCGVIFHAFVIICFSFFKKFFQEHYHSVKQFCSRSGPMLCQALSGSKQLTVKVISRQQSSPLAGKELNDGVYAESVNL